jgi:hypothetical protein
MHTHTTRNSMVHDGLQVAYSKNAVDQEWVHLDSHSRPIYMYRLYNNRLRISRSSISHHQPSFSHFSLKQTGFPPPPPLSPPSSQIGPPRTMAPSGGSILRRQSASGRSAPSSDGPLRQRSTFGGSAPSSGGTLRWRSTSSGRAPSGGACSFPTGGRGFSFPVLLTNISGNAGSTCCVLPCHL